MCVCVFVCSCFVRARLPKFTLSVCICVCVPKHPKLSLRLCASLSIHYARAHRQPVCLYRTHNSCTWTRTNPNHAGALKRGCVMTKHTHNRTQTQEELGTLVVGVHVVFLAENSRQPDITAHMFSGVQLVCGVVWYACI